MDWTVDETKKEHSEETKHCTVIQKNWNYGREVKWHEGKKEKAQRYVKKKKKIQEEQQNRKAVFEDIITKTSKTATIWESTKNH